MAAQATVIEDGKRMRLVSASPQELIRMRGGLRERKALKDVRVRKNINVHVRKCAAYACMRPQVVCV